MADGSDFYNGPFEAFGTAVHVSGAEVYKALYEQAVNNPELFWDREARSRLSWDKEWDMVVRSDFETGEVQWLVGGKINASFNCVDRHIALRKNGPAYFWEGESPGESETITYEALYEKVNKFAALLRLKNVARGDRVVIYMPTVPELPIAMLACARIGAVHCVVDTGFGAPALAYRIDNCGAKALIAAECVYKDNKPASLIPKIEKALEQCPSVETVLMLKRTSHAGRLYNENWTWLQDAISDPELPDYIAPESMDSEDPLLIMYVNGPTGKPKAIVHTHGGYLLYATMTAQMVLDIRDKETIWILEDPAWICGLSYGVYGPLLNGATSVITEASVMDISAGKLWYVVEKYKVAKLCAFPSVFRRIARYEPNAGDNQDLSSLKMIALIGQIVEQEVWDWLYERVGAGRYPILNIYGQAEAGGFLISPFPSVGPLKPGSCSLPFFGIKPIILDPSTGEEVKYPNQEGVLCIEKPWPGMARTIFNDHDRFVEGAFSRVPGYFFTGDGAKQDEDGDYMILGRIDDVINANGRRLGILELESVIMSHYMVNEVAVVSFPHPIKSRGVYGFVSLTESERQSDELKTELQDLVYREIGDFVDLDVIQWVEMLPRTPSGKILRVILQEIAAGNVERLGQYASIADPAVVEKLVKGRMDPDI